MIEAKLRDHSNGFEGSSMLCKRMTEDITQDPELLETGVDNLMASTNYLLLLLVVATPRDSRILKLVLAIVAIVAFDAFVVTKLTFQSFTKNRDIAHGSPIWSPDPDDITRMDGNPNFIFDSGAIQLVAEVRRIKRVWLTDWAIRTINGNEAAMMAGTIITFETVVPHNLIEKIATKGLVNRVTERPGNKYTYHFTLQARDGIDEEPCPLSECLFVNTAHKPDMDLL
jgi:hypothetical protein